MKMDVGDITISETWLSRIVDTGVLVMGGLLTRSHIKQEKQEERVQKLETEHQVLKANIHYLTNNLDDVKGNTDKIINLLLNKTK